MHILKNALIETDMPKMIDVLKQLFSHVPYQLHSKQEKFYHSILQTIFYLAGIKAQSEYSMSNGRIDLVIELPKIMYIIETKFNQSAEKALEQIEARQYWKPFLERNKPIYLVGLSFQRKTGKFNITYVLKKL